MSSPPTPGPVGEPRRRRRNDVTLVLVLGVALVLVLGLYAVPVLLSRPGVDSDPGARAWPETGMDPFVGALVGDRFHAPDVSPVPAAVPPGATVVSITFDDGFAEIDDAARILSEHDVRGTFFVNSGDVGKPDRVGLDDLREIARAGHEIGGHSFAHFDLTELPIDEAGREICQDRSALLGWGFPARSFAYPFAAATPDLERAVAACGYTSARSLEELWDPNWCEDCPPAESIPPVNPYFTRAASQVEHDWDLDTLQSRVRAAQSTGGWLQMTFHRLCTEDCSNPIAVHRALFEEFVAWLTAERDAGRLILLPTGDVIGGAVQEARPGPPPPVVAPGDNMIVNPQLVQQSVAGTPDCWTRTGYGANTATFDVVSTPNGAPAQRVVVSDYRDGDAKLTPTMDLGTCAPAVTPGQRYELATSYVSTVPTRYAVYYRLARGVWTYWTDSPEFAATGTGPGRASWLTPPIPAEATAVSFGLTLTDNGELVTYDYSMVKHNPPSGP